MRAMLMSKLRPLGIGLGLFGGGIAVGVVAVAADKPPAEASVKVAFENARVAARV
jgi:hypothetical protein